jgi:hypothetical protein
MAIHNSKNLLFHPTPRAMKLKMILSAVSAFFLITAGAFFFVKGDKNMSRILFIGGLISMFTFVFWMIVFSKKQ